MGMIYTITKSLKKLTLFRKLLVAVGIVLMFTGLYVLLAENKLLGLPWTWFDTWGGIFILYNYATVKTSGNNNKKETPLEKTEEDVASEKTAAKLIVGLMGIGIVLLLIQISTFVVGYTLHLYLGTIGMAIILISNWLYEVMQD